MQNCSTHLQLVGRNFQVPRSKRYQPQTEIPTHRQRPVCLPGGRSLARWTELSLDERLVEVEISFDAVTGLFEARFEKDDELLITIQKGGSEIAALTFWFDRLAPRKPRVPWAKIQEGERWSASVVLCDFFFEKRATERKLHQVREETARRLSLDLIG